MDLTNEKQIAIAATKQAGQLLMKKFTTHNRANVRLKNKHSIVTPADLASEKIILGAIKKHFPTHKILSEEKGQTGAETSDYLWIVDPLDGTTNFSMGNPLFSISIALSKNNQIILGIIYIPFLDELYLAEIDKPAMLNNKPINVSEVSRIRDALLTFCHGNNEDSIKRAINIHYYFKTAAKDIRQIGSAAIEHAWVARGKIEAIILPGANSWDVAAGVLLVRQAGGVSSDMFGHEWNLNSEGVISTNKKINDTLIRLVKNIK
jgi:myo-inositol-1(or 4)-monophosphatase